MEPKKAVPGITAADKRLLLKIARESLQYFLQTGKIIDYDESVLPDSLTMEYGAFVSLYKGNALRGCIGKLQSHLPLYRTVQELCVSASQNDRRFERLKYNELPQVRFEISILGPLLRISEKSEIILGKHGIYIKKGRMTGTFLPQVATATGWDLEEFLGYCSKDKAGIGWDGWKDAEVYTYTAEVLKEGESSVKSSFQAHI